MCEVCGDPSHRPDDDVDDEEYRKPEKGDDTRGDEEEAACRVD